ncbi:hypothetical protein ECG_00372 [Echinococcus granulosus]|uniref:OST3_OST6 domain containing protein n=1 Tax=Echinococcus granulosus TaxID=6210 RepID=A0A068WXT3_ECHGR|nr:hypothetical protein ECG_00372 [Echinococcus granulosus]CDS22474.1 OST3_OST6 domain containing protein [Echinococcus granulosus]
MNAFRLLMALTTVAFVILMVSGYAFCSIRKEPFWSDHRKSRGRRSQSFSEVIIISLLYAFISGTLIGLVQYCPLKSRSNSN